MEFVTPVLEHWLERELFLVEDISVYVSYDG